MKILKFAGNKYVITVALFAAWMLFFDQNDFFTQRERLRDLDNVRNDIAYLEKQIGKMEKDYNALVSDPQKLEQYAREKYRMKRDNEDVYVIEKK